jgi:signal transduction histidine kinase/DNA-binding CsgD family transcriptional regulator
MQAHVPVYFAGGEICAVALQTLLNLVARLQQVMSVAQGRGMLLDYARKSCGARLALLFALDPERKVLTLLAYAGRHPHPSSFAPETVPIELSLKGLFASVLQRQGFVDIPDISHNMLSLSEERAYAWPRGRVLLHALRQGQRQGVLVFCFGPADTSTVPSEQVQDELLICVSLLSAYLMREEEYQQPMRRIPAMPQKTAPLTKRTPSPKKTKSKKQVEEPEEPPALQFSEIQNMLLRLGELGLLESTQLESQTLNQRMLTLLCATLGASSGCLWRYQLEQQAFLLSTCIGKPDAFTERASSELASLATMLQHAGTEPTYGLIALSESVEGILVWHTLRHREHLLGALGVVLMQEPSLSQEQRLLLNTACHLIALILLHHDLSIIERQKLLEQEQGRIARAIHDSAVQDVAHVMQKLEYTQRILENQPQAALNEIEQARTILNRSLRDLRNGIASLLPVPLEGQAFDEVLKVLLHEYSQNSSPLKISYDLDKIALWPQTLRSPVYHFIQEALNNIRKHASASEVNIRIHQIAGLGFVQISDNGQGFVPEQVHNQTPSQEASTLHIGLFTMEERIRQAGGILEMSSKPGEGTTLKARFPLLQTSTLLTEREREVLSLLVDGLTNRAISERLSVSLETVKSHVHHIMQKMHVKDRTQAAVLATRQQWI